MHEEYISIRAADLQKIANGEINLTEYLLGLVAREQETNRLLTSRCDSILAELRQKALTHVEAE